MKRYRCFLFLPVFILVTVMWLHPNEPPARGDAAAAERYVLWTRDHMDKGLWSEALAGLERAFDYASVSSDISYLLALARSHENKPREAVLQALEFALHVDRWNLYSSEHARLFKAENLIAIRAYPEALLELSMVGDSIRQAELVLKALSASRPVEFRNFL